VIDKYLEDKRKDIADTDREIMELLRKRLDIVMDIGRYKAENGLEVIDPDTEKRVIARYRDIAIEMGLDPTRCETICKIIMEESVEKEKHIQRDEE